MATRFYFQATGTPNITPAFDASWEQTGQAIRLPLVQKPKLEVVTTLANQQRTVPITTTQQILNTQFISDDVFYPVRLDASVLFSTVIRVLESATSANVFLAYILKAITPDGGTVLATLASSMTNAGTEFVATAATRIFGNGTTTVALTATTLSEPWRLVIEVGGHAQAPSAAQSYTARFGTSGTTDFALTSALTTDLNPWMELSRNLDVMQMNNYQGYRVGTGMSRSESIR